MPNENLNDVSEQVSYSSDSLFDQSVSKTYFNEHITDLKKDLNEEAEKKDKVEGIGIDEFRTLLDDEKLFLVTNLKRKEDLHSGVLLEVDFHGNQILENKVRMEDILPSFVTSIFDENNKRYNRKGGKGYFRFGKRFTVFSGTKFSVGDIGEGYSAHYSKLEFKDNLKKSKLSELKKSLSEGKEIDPTESFVKFNDDFGRPVVLRKTAAARFSVARNIARSKGYKLWVDSGYRDFNEQEKLFNQAVKRYGSEKVALKYCAKPGESPHHTGGAMDVFAIPDKYIDKYHCPIYDVGGEKIPLYKMPEHTKVLNEVMASAGFVQYEHESWHYEYGTERWFDEKKKKGYPKSYASVSELPLDVEDV